MKHQDQALHFQIYCYLWCKVHKGTWVLTLLGNLRNKFTYQCWHFLSMLIFSFPFSLLLCVHSSFKNFAYLVICLMESNIGMFTSTFLNVSKISLSTSCIFHFRMTFGGNGRGIGGPVMVEGILGEGTIDVEGQATWASSCLLWCVATESTSFWGVGSRVGTSIFFPYLIVMTLTFLKFSTVCDGNLS